MLVKGATGVIAAQLPHTNSHTCVTYMHQCVKNYCNILVAIFIKHWHWPLLHASFHACNFSVTIIRGKYWNDLFHTAVHLCVCPFVHYTFVFSVYLCKPCIGLLYPPLQRSWKGGILVSPCPSVRLWTKTCLLCIFNNTCRIRFIFAHLIKQLEKVCRI